MNDNKDFTFKVDYYSISDSISVECDKSLTNGDVVLILSNVLSILKEEERETAYKLAIDTLTQKAIN